MDIYTLIKTDHDKAKELMRKIKALPDERHEERLKLFYPFMEEVLVHNEAEEETFYVALMEHDKTKNEAQHSKKEHHDAAGVFEDLDDEDIKPAQWREKFDALCADLLHHITNEENRVFADAKEVLSKDIAERLVGEMSQLKNKKKPIIEKEHAERMASG